MSHNTMTCPRCSSQGRSVAAMNYEETQRWTKRGTFSGSGIGIGTGGVGLGVGGGSYSESGESQSKRANVFDEPGEFAKPVVSIIIMAVIIVAALSAGPSVFSSMSEASGGASSSSASITAMQDKALTIVKYITPVIVLMVLGMSFARAMKNQAENDRLNETERPKLLKRYNELRYCSHCHTLFDTDGHAEDANEIGFEKLLYGDVALTSQ